ncbi:hypothetical protein G6F65_018920 [Rhizopus arrhizus]|nr:hypothetical protein G6F65_018920 [Rhizopus arrhizus]
MWLHRNADGTYQGLDKYSGMLPPVALTFWSLRVAVGLGLLMLAVACVTFVWTFRRGLDPSTLPVWWQRVLCGMMFSGGIAVVAGWWVSIIGLQPFVVNGTITQSEVLGQTASSTILYGLAGYGLLYALLLSAFAAMLFHAARYGVVPGLSPEDPSFWMPLAFMGLLFVVIAAGMVLDGIDLGVGILLQLAPEHERGRMMSLLSPWRDANEFWLLLGMGLFASAFPFAWGAVLG